MEGSLVLTAAKSLETMSFSPLVAKNGPAVKEATPEVEAMDSTAHNSPCEFDWIRTPRAARVRHKYIGNPSSASASLPRMKTTKRPTSHRTLRLKKSEDELSDSEKEKTQKPKKKKRDCRGDSPSPRSPNFLVGTKRKYVEEWLKSLKAINSTKLDKPFGGWQSTLPENGSRKDCN